VGNPYTWERTVTLPGNLNSGQVYWVGAVIDTAGVLSESNESNNAAYVAEVKIY
jgi:hypothetical protein